MFNHTVFHKIIMLNRGQKILRACLNIKFDFTMRTGLTHLN